MVVVRCGVVLRLLWYWCGSGRVIGYVVVVMRLYDSGGVWYC